VYAPFLFFVTLGGSLYAAVAALLSRDQSHNSSISQLARQRVMQHCLMYLLLYGVLLGLLAASYANYQLFEEVPMHSVFLHVTAALTAGRPVFGFLGWLVINRVPQRVVTHLVGHPHSSFTFARAPGMPTQLKQPFLPADAAGASSEWLARRSRASGARPSSQGQGVREAGFKEELRAELVLDVARGISQLANREVHEQGGGVRGSSAPMACDAALIDALCTPSRVASEQPSSPPAQPPPRVQHYAVAHFRAVRAACGISAHDFAAAFAHSHSVSSIREAVSEGASGSFFYFVKNSDGSDTGYIVKQITKREKNTLMSILPAYKAHVQQQQGGSLLQYLSCHSMRLRWEWSGKVYFVVMRNFLPMRPQLVFDLKGATANRRALNTRELHTTNAVAGLYGTLRDWEWMDIAMTTDLREADSVRLGAPICADPEVLQPQPLRDYSLLLGIYRPASDHRQKAALLEQCHGSALVSRDQQKAPPPPEHAAHTRCALTHLSPRARRSTPLASSTSWRSSRCGGAFSGWSSGCCMAWRCAGRTRTASRPCRRRCTRIASAPSWRTRSCIGSSTRRRPCSSTSSGGLAAGACASSRRSACTAPTRGPAGRAAEGWLDGSACGCVVAAAWFARE
jgi:hypothetical protein